MAGLQGETRDGGMTARNGILARIRKQLATEWLDPARERAVANRLKHHAAGVVPEPADRSKNAIARFSEKAEAAGASVAAVARRNVAAAVSNWLRDHNLPQRLRAGADKRLARIKWPSPGGPEILAGASDGRDLTGLAYAFGAASETGTLFLESGPDNPTTLNFLPENHIVLLDSEDIETSYEQVFARLRRRHGEGRLPRAVNLVTGPSRSADIEQTLIMGAHGPVRLHVIIVRD
jgi:L-lactate dehydrogenase complex protein LldG